MVEVLFYGLRAAVLVALLYIAWIGRTSGSIRHLPGWILVTFGFGFLLFGSTMDLAAWAMHLDQNHGAETTIRWMTFLGEGLGYLPGFCLILAGLWKWLPEVRELRKSQTSFQAIINNQTELVFRFGPDDSILFVNAAAGDFFQKRAEELLSMNFKSIIAMEDWPLVESELAKLNRESPIRDLEFRLVAQAKDFRWYHWTFRVFYDDHGDVLEYQAVGFDITRRKNQEEALKKNQVEMQSQLTEISSELSEAKLQLDREARLRREAEDLCVALRTKLLGFMESGAESGRVEPETNVRATDQVESRAGTILVVDDEVILLGITEDMLTQYGYKALVAQSGEEALNIVKKDPQAVDLVILDLAMPGMGGEKCLEELLAIRPELKVILSSGFSHHKMAQDPQTFGAMGFVQKPYRVEDMLAKIRSALGQPPA